MMDLQNPDDGDKPSVIVICGPTAVGKTTAGIQLARAVGGEIISADSMQVYRHMDIGTAKPTAAEQALVRHHLIDIVDPDEPFDAAAYKVLGRQAVAELTSRGKTPIVVGGTGLYIKALFGGLFRADARDLRVRNRLRAEAQTLGSEAFHARLQECDPQTAARLHPNDSIRILRALEVFEVTGQPISMLQREHRFGDAPFRTLKLGLSVERDALYRRIDLRVQAMVAAGLEDEVRSLLAQGYGPELKPLKSIGYSHMAGFISGALSWEESLRTFKRDTRRFAKRQLTWFRADPEIVWLVAGRPEELVRLSTEFLGLA